MNHNTTLSFQHCYELQSNIIHYTFIITKNLPINAVVSSSLWRSSHPNHANTKRPQHVPEQTL